MIAPVVGGNLAMPSGWAGIGTDQVPITVWTSEGSRTLRDRARIRMPAPTRGADPDVLSTNGTCRTEPSAG